MDQACNGHTERYRRRVAVIRDLADELDSRERTLRRAVDQGTVRSRRLGPRRLRISEQERSYLRSHWRLLATLRELLRTERQISFAVLHGSAARGDDGPVSDVDLLIGFRPGAEIRNHRGLARKLRSELGREVDIADAEDVAARSPLLLSRVVEEGRLLVDRDGAWAQRLNEKRAIRARGERAYRREMAEAARAIVELTERA
jgi:predicted nucleotidyltransferase